MTFVQPGRLSDTTQHDSTKSDSTKTDSTTDTTTVQYASLALTVALHGEDSVLAQLIGSPGGVLSDAFVTISRGTSGASHDTATTDSTGVAHFTHLLPSNYYSVAVIRELTPSETALFDSANADVNAFGGGGAVTVKPPSSMASVEVAAGRRGSLVISEDYEGQVLVNGAAYYLATFLELYNNADTTIDLDGKLVGLGPPYLRDFSNLANSPVSCSEGAPYQLDPNGLWSDYIWRFPGSGHQYPLAPGHTAVLATDAVDHSRIDPRLPDLSHADFEFIGSSDVDNPSVPNMIQVGPKEQNAVIGHGLDLATWDGIIYVANPTDLSTLPTARLPSEAAYLTPRIPRAKILDVFTTTYDPAGEATLTSQGVPLCDSLISPVFDRQPGALVPYAYSSGTIVRRVFSTLPNGQVVLLRTKATADDFENAAAPTPGRVP